MHPLERLGIKETREYPVPEKETYRIIGDQAVILKHKIPHNFCYSGAHIVKTRDSKKFYSIETLRIENGDTIEINGKEISCKESTLILIARDGSLKLIEIELVLAIYIGMQETIGASINARIIETQTNQIIKDGLNITREINEQIRTSIDWLARTLKNIRFPE